MKRNIYVFVVVMFLSHLVSLACLAEINVTFNLDSNAVSYDNDLSALVIITGDVAPDIPPPVFESSDKFNVSPEGRDVSSADFNGKGVNQVIYSYKLNVIPGLSLGKHVLPAAYVESAGKKHRLQWPEVTVYNTSTEIPPRSKPYLFTHSVDIVDAYVGEQVVYTLRAVTPLQTKSITINALEFSGFWKEHISKVDRKTEEVDARKVNVSIWKEALFAAKSGDLRLPARTLTVKFELTKRPRTTSSLHSKNDSHLTVFERAFNVNIFEQLPPANNASVIQDYLLSTPAFVVHVRKLPPHEEKLDYIPVGDIKISSTIDNSSVQIGESIRLSILLSGDGNLRPLVLKNLVGNPNSRFFKFYFDKSELLVTESEGRLHHKKIFNIEVLPRVAGHLKLPVFKIVSFNPSTKSYESLRTPAYSVFVQGTEAEVREGALSSSPEVAISSQKREVVVLGEDLRAQMSSHQAGFVKKRLSQLTLVVVLVAIPVFCLFAVIVMRKWGELRVKMVSSERRALSRALLRLNELGVANPQSPFDEFGCIFCDYVRERFDLKAGVVLTSAEAGEILKEHVSNREVVNSIDALLIRLDELSFGPKIDEKGGGISSELDEIIKEFSSILKRCG